MATPCSTTTQPQQASQAFIPDHPLGNPEDESDLLLTSPIPSMLGNPGDQYMYCSPGWHDGFSLSDLGIELSDPPEGIPAVDAAAGGEIGRTVSGSLGGDLTTPAGALHVDAVEDEFSPGPRHGGSHVHMDGGQSLAHQVRVCTTDISTATNGAVLEAGSVEDDSVGRPRRRRRLLPVLDCQGLKSAQGFIQPETGTDEIRNRPGPSAPGIDEQIPRPTYEPLEEDYLCWRTYDLLLKAKYCDEADVIQDLSAVLRGNGISDYCKDRFVDPHEPPTSRQGRYFTIFDPRLEGDKPKSGKRSHSHWNEIDAKPIRDPLALGTIIGLKRRLEYYLNGSEKTRWRADEYVALKAMGGGDLQIQEEIAVRAVYEEEDSETAPPSKCPKSCPHCHSSEGSYIWEYMRRIFVKVEGEARPEKLYGICNECDKALKCPPKSGTTNLNRHLANVHGIHPPCRSQQVMTNKGKGKAIVLRG